METAVELDPNSSWTAGYYQSLAIAYIHLTDFETAEYYGEKVRKTGDFSHWSSLAHLYLMQEKYDMAENLAKQWYSKSPYALRHLTEIEVNYHQNYKKAIDQY